MIKVMCKSQHLEMGAMVGIDPASDGLARAARLSVPTTHECMEGLRGLPNYADVGVVFDATSAGAHPQQRDSAARRQEGDRPDAGGDRAVHDPCHKWRRHLDEPNVNMVTCGGQATIPIVHAVRRATNRVIWGDIVASISSKSAVPGTRANIDEFTETTSKAICEFGGAERGKAIIILNPAEPPLIMRDTVFTLHALAGRPSGITGRCHFRPSPRLRWKLQSIPPPGVNVPDTCCPNLCSSAGRHGTSWKPRPSSIMANRPDASVMRWR